MKINKIIALALVLALLLCLCGCNKKDNNPSPGSSAAEATDEFVIYHSSKELDSLLASAARAYENATGKKIGVKFYESGLAAAAETENPAIYVVDSGEDLSSWHEKGLFGEISNEFFGSEAGVPSGLWMNSGAGNYGIPLMLEGYGYIFDRDMLSDLFGVEDVSDLVSDLRECSYNDFMGFVSAVETYISAPSAASVTVNGNEYTFAEAKTGRAQMLSGVFALTSESSRAYEYLMNYALAAKFGERNEIFAAAENDVTGAKGAFAAAAQALDDLTSHVAGTGGAIGRGEDFVGGDYTYSAAIDAFTGGFALFYPGSSLDASDFKKSSVTFGENLDILPMKLPLSESDVTASGTSAEKLNRSIVIASRYYITFNPNADAAAASSARDFVKWLYTEAEGMAAYSEAFGGVAFNYTEPLEGRRAQRNASSGSLSTENETASAENGASGGVNGTAGNAGSVNGSADNGVTDGENSGAASSGTLDSILSSSPGSENSGAASAENGANGGYVISDSLARAVARYYTSGNWIPELVSSLPSGWRSDTFGKSLTDYWNKPAWSEEDRESLVSGWMTGWTEGMR